MRPRPGPSAPARVPPALPRSHWCPPQSHGAGAPDAAAGERLHPLRGRPAGRAPPLDRQPRPQDHRVSDSERGTGPPGTPTPPLPVSGPASSGPSGTPPPSRYPAPSSGTDPTTTTHPLPPWTGPLSSPPPAAQPPPRGSATSPALPGVPSPAPARSLPSPGCPRGPSVGSERCPPSGPRYRGSAGCGVGDSLGDPRWGCPPCPGGQSRLQEHGQLLALPPQRGVTVARSGGFANWSQFPRHWVGGPVSGRCRRLAADGLTFGGLAGGFVYVGCLQGCGGPADLGVRSKCLTTAPSGALSHRSGWKPRG